MLFVLGRDGLPARRLVGVEYVRVIGGHDRSMEEHLPQRGSGPEWRVAPARPGEDRPRHTHGILTQDEADATAQADDDPYLTDVYVRPGESFGGPDGGPAAPRPALESKNTSAKADTQADIERMQRIWTDRD
jgi:hypothetical protein